MKMNKGVILVFLYMGVIDDRWDNFGYESFFNSLVKQIC